MGQEKLIYSHIQMNDGAKVCNFPGWHQKLQKHAKPLFYNVCII